MHAAPNPDTLWRVIPPSSATSTTVARLAQQRQPEGTKGDNLLLATTGLPADLDQYIVFSQMAQAEG